MDSLLVQSWTFFALSVSIIFARLISRRIMLKAFKKLQSDDWIMISLLLPLTAFAALTVSIDNASPKEQRTYRYVLEEVQIIITWLVKACLLVLYWRIFPVAFSTLRRRYIQIVSTICALSFVTTEISLLSGCSLRHLDGQHCSTYYSYTIISLTFSSLTTILVLVIPIPFIPTPRRLLLVILMVTGISIATLGIIARNYMLTAPTSKTYLFYYTYETTLLIVFANLPFLTSLVVTATPASLREFSRNFSLSRETVQTPLSLWPRSRRVSVHDVGCQPLRSSRLDSAVTVTSEDTEKESTPFKPVARPQQSAKHGPSEGRRPESGMDRPLVSQERLV